MILAVRAISITCLIVAPEPVIVNTKGPSPRVPKELLFLSDTLPSAVFHVAECHLIHAINPLYLLASWYIYYTRNGVNLLLEMPNKSVFP